MVLDDVGNSAPDSFSDTPYPSSNDAYASATPPSGKRFDSSTFPQPFPILGKFMGFSDASVRFKTEITLQFAEQRLGRTLYPDEAQAFAFHMYQLQQTKSYYAAAGSAAGTYRCWSTAAEMRYPFFKPNPESIDKNKFAMVRGPMAMFARHTWRFSLYALAGGQIGSLIGQVIGHRIAAINSAKDPKLKQFSMELKAASYAGAQKTMQIGKDIEHRRRNFEEQVRNRSGGGPSPEAGWGKQPAAKKEGSADDMSPTAGNEAWGSQSPTAESWETFSNDTPQPAPGRQQDRPSTENWNRQSQASSPFDDDASPTGGLFQDEFNNPQLQSQSPSRPGESSWDRLRRGGAPIPGQRAQPQSRRPDPERREQREASTLDDPYAFVEGDEKRKRAREQAQQATLARSESQQQGQDSRSDNERWW